METTEYSNISSSFPKMRNRLRHGTHQNDVSIDGTLNSLVVGTKPTKHGSVRSQQRGFQAGDADMIFQYGTMFGDDQVFLSNKDADGLIRTLKQKIKKIDRLRNRMVVVDGNSLITC